MRQFEQTKIILELFDTFNVYENTATDSQIYFMNSIKEFYNNNKYLTENQILAVQKIIDQNIEFRNSTSNSFFTFKNNTDAD